ncbi:MULTISPECIES: TetR/AcrR family transcriptional regulator [Burkholderia cepacia complex]|uniref:TetR/AcrR family transcriptional regulator n=1 Tax=Burkholderia cepacia complex TaxID=87882 RepID=UPI0019048F67|nr:MULTISPECIES: TetR/AcrR family transcriptional regulator [Burkholderia cepacia complex]MBK1824526.1 TetR/AcrR family transcriptional regulator [Burkholderia orbicola]MBN3568507.1 TetR/AcrR family transcriptional regulator [Burkholderia cenocepacia]MBR8112558.1 TetR/AcrR family transcriptional regulator [Burkholderia cenocepacia]
MQARKTTKKATVTRGEGRVQDAAQTSKRERVLDVAERLFAEGGFDGVSMRDIASAADVGLPLIVYHFETKMGLYRALFERRKTVLDARLAMLREPVAAGEDPLEHIVRAFVLPVMQIQGTDAGLAYAKLVAREASDPREAERGIVAEYFDPFAAEFIGAIKKALPGHGASYAHWAYLFAVGALVMSAFDSRIERISNGKVKAGALKSKTTHLVTFITAGIRAGATPV